MKSSNSIILFVLLAIFYYIESISMPKHRLTREVPEQVPAHSSFNIEQDDLIYQFIAFFVPEDKYYIHRFPLIGMAALVTDRHALTAASVIIEYLPDNLKKIVIKIEGYSAFCRAHKSQHKLIDAKPHPHFRNSVDDPYADIAVVFFEEPTLSKTENTKIPVSLLDVDESFIVTQLGRAPFTTGRCRVGSCNGTRRRFRVSLIDDKPYLFKSDPIYHATKSDHGGPVFIEGREGRFELVGITSKPSEKRPALHTKIYSFLPFIIEQLNTDGCIEYSPLYDPHLWINNQLRYQQIRKQPFSTRFSKIKPTDARRVLHQGDMEDDEP